MSSYFCQNPYFALDWNNMVSHLSIGIVGLPNVGKSTLFQTLTKKQVDCSNYPFATIDPNVGVVAVPDPRVDKLAELEKFAKKIFATVEFFDIAGLVKGASEGQGLGNKFLANIRETDAVLYVLRGFAKKDIINTLPDINPVREKEILDTELALKDLETVSKRLESLGKEAKAGKKEAQKEAEVVGKAKSFLEKGLVLADQNFSEEEKDILKSCQLLTLKPRLFLLNASEGEVPASVLAEFQKNKWPYLVIDVLTELEAGDFSREERVSFGLKQESELDLLIQKSYELLDLITFFTTVSNQVQAWTVKRGTNLPRAGGVIHSDFENHFIKAEIINYKDLILAGSFTLAREKGLIRTEGKDYIVQDGDVIEIKHSV